MQTLDLCYSLPGLVEQTKVAGHCLRIRTTCTDPGMAPQGGEGVTVILEALHADGYVQAGVTIFGRDGRPQKLKAGVNEAGIEKIGTGIICGSRGLHSA